MFTQQSQKFLFYKNEMQNKNESTGKNVIMDEIYSGTVHNILKSNTVLLTAETFPTSDLFKSFLPLKKNCGIVYFNINEHFRVIRCTVHVCLYTIELGD